MSWSNRHRAYAERKEREALEADLPGYHTQIDRLAEVPGLIPVGNAWTKRLYDGEFGVSLPESSTLPALSLVFVQSRDGNTGTRRPWELGGGATDAHLIYEGVSRVAADGVLAGARTVRGADMLLSVWHPEFVALRSSLGKPRHPTQIVVTHGALDLDGDLMFNVPDAPVVVLTPASGIKELSDRAARRPWMTLVEIGADGSLVPPLAALRRAGLSTISAIGGRTVATELLDAGVVRDLYLTSSPIDAGEPNTPWYIGKTPPALETVARKAGTREEAGVTFEHFRVRPPTF